MTVRNVVENIPQHIDRRYMEESLRCFVEECMAEEGFVKPDIFILIAGQGKDLTFSSSSNSSRKTMETLLRAVYRLQEGNIAKLEDNDD